MDGIFTISVFAENSIAAGTLGRTLLIFTRRRLAINSLMASASEMKGIDRYTIVLKATKEQVDKIIRQIEKLVEVSEVFAHEESGTIE